MASIEEPKKPMTTFFIYLNENRAKFTQELGDKAKERGAISAYASQKYNSLSAEQKKVYEQKSAEQKAAYEKAMAEFKAQGGQVGQRKAEKRERKEKKEKRAARKASNMPKRPAGGAYGCYLAEHRALIQSSLPAGSPCTEASKVASDQWKKLSPKDKEKFEKVYEKKKAAYEEAMKEWKAKQTCEDGEDEDEGEEDAEDAAAEDEVLAMPSPPKKARLSAPSSKGKSEGSEMVLAEAKKEGLALKLKTLMENPKTSGKDAGTLLDALRKADGKVVEAKKALLS